MNNLDSMRERAWDEAEARYHKCYNANHERIRPFATFDEIGFIRWGQLWALLVSDFDDADFPADEQLEEIFTADMAKVLELMYG